jgi:hypothetical protein
MYAELLSNIRQISIIVTLPTPCDASTKIELVANGRLLILNHGGSSSSLHLPGQAAQDFGLQKPVLGSKELSWRLPLNLPPSRVIADLSPVAPWPATDFNEDAEFSCRSCGTPILGKGVIRNWRDLPSENWAEMMDFWHCHKPDVPAVNRKGHHGHSHDDPNASRGFGANANFIAQSSVGFVDLTTLLVSRFDCQGIEVRCLSIFPLCSCIFSSISSSWVSRRRPGLHCFSMAWSPIQTPYINTFNSTGGWSYLPFPLDYGFDDQSEDETLAFHSISSPRCWKAMGLAQGTELKHLEMKLPASFSTDTYP